MITLTALKRNNDIEAILPFQMGSRLKRLQRPRSNFDLDNARQYTPDPVKAHLATEEDHDMVTLRSFVKKPDYSKTHSEPCCADLCRQRQDGRWLHHQHHNTIRFSLVDDSTSSSSNSSDLLLPPIQLNPTPSTLSQFVVTKKQNVHQRQPWRSKTLVDWSNEDVLQWLQYMRLSDSDIPPLTGVKYSGRDLVNCNDNLLAEIGVHQSASRMRILQELDKQKRKAMAQSNSIRPRALFPLLAEHGHGTLKPIFIAADVQLDQLEVSETPQGGLFLEREYPVLDLHTGDIVLELNGACCIGMTKEFFRSLMERTRGKIRKLVILSQRLPVHLVPTGSPVHP